MARTFLFSLFENEKSVFQVEMFAFKVFIWYNTIWIKRIDAEVFDVTSYRCFSSIWQQKIV